MREFNTSGPVDAELHYRVPPLDRVNLAQIIHLVRSRRYFVMHAPRQSGKTSALLALRDLLNGGSVGEYRCAYVNVESAQTAGEDVGRAMRAIALQMAGEAEDALKDEALAQAALRLDTAAMPDSALWSMLRKWAKADARPLVILIDEIDSMVGDSLVSVLRQLRTGYAQRPAAFPQSVILCGIRDVRDYRIRASSEKEIITGGSAFNIKAESLRLGDFARAEVATLLGQHTADTGQQFAPEAVDAVWEQTRGQPWLVNALCRQLCFLPEGEVRPREGPITAHDVFDAREALILRRDTHIDQLFDKLVEPRVRRVLEPLLSGGDDHFSERDFEYVRDLGLVAPDPPLRVANPIYREILPRELTSFLKFRKLKRPPKWYERKDGRLDMDKLLESFQDFWRSNSEHWIKRAQYTEAGPHLVLQAFLHRVFNGRGRIDREYGVGSGRVDLMAIWPDPAGGVARFMLECKLVKRGGEGTHSAAVEKGLDQTARYMDAGGAGEGHLVVFDARKGRSWEDRIWREEREREGKKIVVWGA